MCGYAKQAFTNAMVQYVKNGLLPHDEEQIVPLKGRPTTSIMRTSNICIYLNAKVHKNSSDGIKDAKDTFTQEILRQAEAKGKPIKEEISISLLTLAIYAFFATTMDHGRKYINRTYGQHRWIKIIMFSSHCTYLGYYRSG